jgi:hypothetical protein
VAADASTAVTPGVSDARDFTEFATGMDLIQRQPLTGWGRFLTGAGLLTPVVGGTFYRKIGGKLFKVADEAPDATRMHQLIETKAKRALNEECPPPVKVPSSELKSPPPKRGNAPIGNDGKPVELHHRHQTPDSPLDEMSRTDHRGAGNFGKNHPNTGQVPSQIDRTRWKQEQKKYWENEWDTGRFDDL